MRAMMTRWWVWALVLPVAGCSACEPVRPKAVGAQCTLTSECDAPLVCRLDNCRIECSTSRDCAAGLDCVLDNEGFGACQLPEDTDCALDSDCPADLVCAMGRCSNACNADEDCAPGARCFVIGMPEGTACAAGATCGCVDPDRDACVYNEDCPDRKICAPDQRCRDECLSTADCRYGTICEQVRYEGDAGPEVSFCQPMAPTGP